MLPTAAAAPLVSIFRREIGMPQDTAFLEAQG